MLQVNSNRNKIKPGPDSELGPHGVENVNLKSPGDLPLPIGVFQLFRYYGDTLQRGEKMFWRSRITVC